MIQTLERNIKGYEDLAGKPLDEDSRVIALTGSCVPEWRHTLELEHREVSYKEQRDLVISYIEGRRDSSGHAVPKDGSRDVQLHGGNSQDRSV